MFLRENLLPCCRRRIRVNFQEIGWGAWIAYPEGFDSYYCLGRCSTFGGFAPSDANGAALYADMMNQKVSEDGKAPYNPCCSPVKFAPLSLTTVSGNREEVTQSFQDMIVTHCGCMWTTYGIGVDIFTECVHLFLMKTWTKIYCGILNFVSQDISIRTQLLFVVSNALICFFVVVAYIVWFLKFYSQ